MESVQSLHISKLDAAKRQMETAIRLYFHSADPVSIHTLIAASYDLLVGVNASRGGGVMMKDLISTWVKPGEEKEAHRKINEAQNFFKHADRDPSGVLDFRPDFSEMLLYEAGAKYQELTGEVTMPIAAFRLWFTYLNRDTWELTAAYKAQLDAMTFKPTDRAQFIASFAATWVRQHAS